MVGTAETPGKRYTGSGSAWWNSLVGAVGSSTTRSRCKHVGNSSGSRLETVSEEGGMVITGSRTGTGETGRLRVDPKPLALDEIEAEQDAIQIHVRKGPVLHTADQVRKTQCDAPSIP